MVKLIIRQDIRIKNLPLTIAKEIKKELTIDNPDFVKKHRLGFWLGGTPKELELFVTIDNDLIVPYGLKGYLIRLLEKHKTLYELNIKHAKKPIKMICKDDLGLYAYQQRAVDKVLEFDNGILVSPAGSGKTRMAMEIIKKRSVKTLWITHTLDLLRQSKRVFKTFFDNKVGEISGGKVDIQEVTFATVQTLNNVDLSVLKDEFGMLIVDETHRATGSPSRVMMFYKVITNINAKYKYGLTATLYPKTNDISSTPLYLIGDELYRVDENETKQIKAIHNIINTSIGHNDMFLKPDKTIDYHELANYLVYNQERNNVIFDNLVVCKNRHNIVLTTRNDHIEILGEMLDMVGIDNHIIIGSVKESEREIMLQDFRDGKVKFLLSNYQLAKEGLDLPIADTLHLIMPMRDKTTIVQSKGRVERYYKGKKQPIVYDYVDNIGTLLGMLRDRKRYMKWNILITLLGN